jgi:hypothetical protein
MRIPPSHEEKPAMLCPPPLTATTILFSRAKLTAWTTSLTPTQRAMTAGRRSNMPFQILRCVS